MSNTAPTKPKTRSAGPAPAGTPPHVRPFLRPTRLLNRVDASKLHPTVLAEAEHRAASLQLRLADAITTFAGSMTFVYIHVALFIVWMLFIEKNPWPTLTLAVSLEAIFLSTFVMIGQNRQSAFQQAKADRDYNDQEKLLVENTDLTRIISDLTQRIHDLTQEIHERVLLNDAPHQAGAAGAAAPAGADDGGSGAA
jgi:Predicted membrane protein